MPSGPLSGRCKRVFIGSGLQRSQPRSILDEGFTKIKKNKSHDSVSHVPNKETFLETDVVMTNIVFAHPEVSNLKQFASPSLAKYPLVTSCDRSECVQACLHMFGLMSRCPVSSCISRSTHAGIFFHFKHSTFRAETFGTFEANDAS